MQTHEEKKENWRNKYRHTEEYKANQSWQRFKKRKSQQIEINSGVIDKLIADFGKELKEIYW